MADPFIGEIRSFGGNFAPRGWAKCDGSLINIADNSALFSLLGTTYGGDGRTTFGLPDLRGRAPMGDGHGTGLTIRKLGQKGGTETETLSTSEMPSISSVIKASNFTGTSPNPNGHYLAHHSDDVKAFATSKDTTMGTGPIAFNSGGGQAHSNMQPFLALNFIIALEGTFPVRN